MFVDSFGGARHAKPAASVPPEQALADLRAERDELGRHAHAQEGLRRRADVGMQEASAELAAAQQRESELRVDNQVRGGSGAGERQQPAMPPYVSVSPALPCCSAAARPAGGGRAGAGGSVGHPAGAGSAAGGRCRAAQVRGGGCGCERLLMHSMLLGAGSWHVSTAQPTITSTRREAAQREVAAVAARAADLQQRLADAERQSEQLAAQLRQRAAADEVQRESQRELQVRRPGKGTGRGQRTGWQVAQVLARSAAVGKAHRHTHPAPSPAGRQPRPAGILAPR